ncbi:tetratricopeptide repeat protein [Leptospira weilii]|uniref:tetratricopeptide repeat protein n=1 Tax=Leptospira weilii TaxID=28184 RepID=UPI00201B7E46|nr:tetratricopeptide repeat protein [Leptospira weilii]UPY79903.1 tetratricopeptide repeat protein [Leptospira weilii]UPY80358.1 tetratricopeptide repeat protein [Leptospira weilii]UPY80823.1 tetratricopeptide repeat protein [Leptospira weilii]
MLRYGLFFFLTLSPIFLFSEPESNEAKKLYELSIKTRDENEKNVLRQKIIEISPDSPYGFFSKAYLAEQRNEYDVAESMYLKAVELNPKFAQAYANLGRLMLNLGKPYGYAMDYYQNAIEIEPNNSDFNSGLCYAYIKDPNPSNGIKYCNKAVELDPKSSVAYLARASIRLACSDFRGSIRDSNIVLKLNPKNAEAYHLRGLNQFALKNVDLACKDLSIAGELGSSEAYEVMTNHCK